jgi:hypothetical protein
MKLTVAVVSLLALVVACAEPVSEPEQQIRDLLTEIERASRDKDIGALKDTVSASYSDKVGRSQEDLHNLIKLHYFRRRDVFLLTRIETLELPAPGQAKLSVLAAMAGTPLESEESLRDVRADLYRFDLELRDEGAGQWRVTSGAWRPARMDDFFEAL